MFRFSVAILSYIPFPYLSKFVSETLSYDTLVQPEQEGRGSMGEYFLEVPDEEGNH